MTRSRGLLVFVLALVAAFAWQARARVGQEGGAPGFSTGDTNGDGELDISDAIYLVSYLFLDGPAPAPCEAQGGLAARDVSFDPSGSTLSSLNVQAALLELHQKVETLTALNSSLQVRVGILEDLNPTAKPVQIDVVPIPAGTFIMGSLENEVGRRGDETRHLVHITRPFFLGVTHVTQAQYEAIMGENPTPFVRCPDCPVIAVNWNRITEFLRKLTERQRAAGKIGPRDFYRLPTESEWEYACRAGTTTRFSFGDVLSECPTNDFCTLASEYMWWGGNLFVREPKPVAQKKPNPWGLYDMNGNVNQICSDYVGAYPIGEVTDPTGPESGTAHVSRGGSFESGLWDCRSAGYRNAIEVLNGHNDKGFRVVLEVVP